MAVLFGTYHNVTVVRGDGKAAEKQTEVRVGGSLDHNILFHPGIDIVRGDEIRSPVLDEPRVVTRIHPKFAMSGEVTHYEADILPQSEWQERQAMRPAATLGQDLTGIMEQDEQRRIVGSVRTDRNKRTSESRSMTFKDRWERVRGLGEGGQGKVILVRDREGPDSAASRDKLVATLRGLVHNVNYQESHVNDVAAFQKCILDIVRADSPDRLGALKILHAPRDARDSERASERIRREMKAMEEASHPNLLRILDSDADERRFVSEYHPGGALQARPELFKGNLAAALSAFRPLVAGVAVLHEKNIIHRDIKPGNVFISAKDELVLGDFGLVFFSDDAHTRLSGTLENVGSRDWMPPWAVGSRIDDIKPNFDVFCLGKLLWSMLSGLPFLQLWYYNKEMYNVERMFPSARHISLANPYSSASLLRRKPTVCRMPRAS